MANRIPFSQLVRGSAWRSEAEGWVADAVGGLGARITGVTQPRVRPWSTQLVVETTRGRFWFKANCAASAFEPQLQSVLAGLAPGDVDQPVAIDAERGWMLTADRGATLPESREPTPDDWVAVVRAWAGLQHLVASDRDELLAAGLPDCGPETVPTRFDDLLGRLTTLPAGHPSHLDGSGATRLARARYLVEDAAATLADGPFPVTLQHGDLHPWNVFLVDGSLRIFDFGDTQWAHPLESLMVPRAVVEAAGRIPWEPIQTAFLKTWELPVEAGAMVELLRAAQVTHAVNRASSWWDALAEATDAERDDWGEAPARHLARVVEGQT
ncbi:phosphotransferase [Promicromonospora sp. Populi]|uniref:phosphotransferase n=1 Tax=Promicromonospora sp. Populi TaxID=3239420 RepID=UPI0034E246E0